MLATLGIGIYLPAGVPLVIFPAEMSLYGSNCTNEAKSCVQPWVTLRWGRMVEQEPDQPGLGKDSVPELPGSALGAPVPLCPARPCEEWMAIHSQRLSFVSRYSFKYSAGWLSGF